MASLPNVVRIENLLAKMVTRRPSTLLIKTYMIQQQAGGHRTLGVAYCSYAYFKTRLLLNDLIRIIFSETNGQN